MHFLLPQKIRQASGLGRVRVRSGSSQVPSLAQSRGEIFPSPKTLPRHPKSDPRPSKMRRGIALLCIAAS